MDSSLVTLFLIIGLLSGTAMGILTWRLPAEILRPSSTGEAGSTSEFTSNPTVLVRHGSPARLDASQREMSPLRPACFNTLSLAGRALCDDGRHLLCPPSSINDNVTGAFSVLLVCTRTQRDRSAALPFTRQAHATVTVGWPVF